MTDKRETNEMFGKYLIKRTIMPFESKHKYLVPEKSPEEKSNKGDLLSISLKKSTWRFKRY